MPIRMIVPAAPRTNMRLTHTNMPTEHGHEHHHSHDLPATHPDEANQQHEGTRTLRLEQEALAKNNLIAARNRGWFEGRQIVALNLMSSPGAGKTTLLERTIRDLGDEPSVFVIEGDQETMRDAERIRATGCRVIQVNTAAVVILTPRCLPRLCESSIPVRGRW
jgi:hydrogenase nickel incorporation protein HypB